jgi:hypothetical protein
VAALFLDRKEWAAEKLDTLLSELEDRGLVGWDRRTNQYDLHPIVRGVVWRGLDEIKRQQVYGTLEEYFSAVPANPEGLTTVAEALPMIELFTALVGLGRFDDATALFFTRIHNRGTFSFLHEGMQHVHIAMMESLFPDGLDQPPRSKIDSSTVLSHLGYGYAVTGRLAEGRTFYARALAADSDVTRAILHDTMSKIAHDMGRLREAIEQGEASVAASDDVLGKYHIARLGQHEVTVGNLQSASTRIGALNRDQYFDPDRYLAQIYLRLGENDRAAGIAMRELASHYRETRVEMTFVFAEAQMHLGQLDVAPMLLDILREARAKTHVLWELQALHILADLYRRLRDYKQSRTYLEDLAEPAARGPYRLIQADAANVLAELERDCGNREAAIAAAQEAYRLAWCDGPPYAYHWALEHAKRLAHELGAELPEI